MNKIDANAFLSDILKKYPEAMEVFLANGFEDFTENDVFNEIGPFIKLKTMLKARNINEEFYTAMLNDRISTGLYHDFLPKPQLETKDKMNLLALLPCPLKLPLQEAFKEYIQSRHLKQQYDLNYLIEGNANNQLSYYSYVEQFDDIDEIPDIVISPGINSFYYKRFIDKFIDKGYFADAAEYVPKGALSKIGIKDPGGNYTVLSMNLLVMVVDKLRAGNLPIPKTWGDLLNPEFEKKVAIRGQNDFFCETTLLTIFKQFGIEGIRKFGRAVKYGWHPAQMAKAAGSGGNDSPMVSIMPYFFTKTIKHKENVEVIWPEDGAIISPVTMLVKAEKAESLKKVTEFFTGVEVGRISASASFPAVHPEVDCKLPGNARFNWIGWEFIKENDVGSLVKKLNSEFLRLFNA